jgi:acyl dehydratase
VRWLKPLRPGTQIRVRGTVLDKRASNSRPEMGFVKYHFEVLDELHAPMATLTTTLMLERRRAGAAA